MIVFKTVMKGIRTRFATELLNEPRRDYYPARTKVLTEFATMPSAGWSGLSSSGLVSAGGTPFDVQEATILVSEAKNGGRQYETTVFFSGATDRLHPDCGCSVAGAAATALSWHLPIGAATNSPH